MIRQGVLLCVLLGSTSSAADLSPALQQAAVGLLDATSSRRERVPDPRENGRRKVVIWEKGSARLNSSSLKVYYDAEQRAASWQVSLTSRSPLRDFLGSARLRVLGRFQGRNLYRASGGTLEGVLIAQKGTALDFYSSAYALRYVPELSLWARTR